LCNHASVPFDPSFFRSFIYTCPFWTTLLSGTYSGGRHWSLSRRFGWSSATLAALETRTVLRRFATRGERESRSAPRLNSTAGVNTNDRLSPLYLGAQPASRLRNDRPTLWRKNSRPRRKVIRVWFMSRVDGGKAPCFLRANCCCGKPTLVRPQSVLHHCCCRHHRYHHCYYNFVCVSACLCLLPIYGEWGRRFQFWFMSQEREVRSGETRAERNGAAAISLSAISVARPSVQLCRRAAPCVAVSRAAATVGGCCPEQFRILCYVLVLGSWTTGQKFSLHTYLLILLLIWCHTHPMQSAEQKFKKNHETIRDYQLANYYDLSRKIWF